MIRNHEIDGIRGWAALLVVCSHMFHEIFVKIIPSFESPAFGFIFYGGLAVKVFFILSGDALSVGFFQRKDYGSLTRLAVLRYFRLTFLIAISCFLVYLVMVLNWQYNIEANKIVNRDDWLGIFVNFQPNVLHLLEYSFYDVYFNHTTETSYNPFLWTMSVEMLGSLLVFINLFIFAYIKKPLVILFIQLVFLWFFGSLLALFIMGMILGYLRTNGILDNISSKKFYQISSLIMLFIVIVIVSYLKTSNQIILGIPAEKFVRTRIGYIWPLLIVFIIYTNFMLLKFFRNKISVFLGEISFPLYAIQFVVIISYTSFLIVYLNEINYLNQFTSLIIAGSSVFLTIALSYPFYKIELSYLKFIKKIYINYIQK